MATPKYAPALALVPFAVLLACASTAESAAKGAEQTRVIVVYKVGQRANAERALAMAGAERHLDLAEQRSFAVSLPAVAVAGLSSNPAIDYVEEDAKRYPLGLATAEVVPYGIVLTQSNQVADTGADASMVCIIDSGIDIGHPDHSPSGTKIKGYSDTGVGSWTTASPSTWYTDENHHGTHVAGTIAALGGNSKGVVGVAPTGTLNLFIVKVFGASAWAYSSSLVDALNRCTAAASTSTTNGFPGRKLVVSMSLGGSVKSRTEETAFNNAYTKSNVLPIAAAGNDGNNRLSYPAGYSGVMSVAAVDQSKAKASFSQYNSDVEIAAPGVAVLSTVPRGTGSEAAVTVDAASYLAAGLDGSPKGTATGSLVDCGLAGTVCAGATGKVCLIERGTYNFSDKVLNCQNGGGIGAIVYNNVAGGFGGTLNGVVTTIPSVSVAQADGQSMKATNLGKPATVALTAADYAEFDGTSMATPHVSAIAALIWSYAPKCTNAQVRNALNSTAEDLGALGRDVNFGFGLVRAKNAKDALVALGCR